MSLYTQFVKAHIHSAPGKSFKDKMKAVAAMWRRQKGKGLATPGAHVGRGGAIISPYTRRTNDWTDFGDKPAIDGEGVKRRRPRMRKSGGALSGMISAKQMAALRRHVKRGGDTSHGALADLLKGLNIKIT